jgi:hypothetical protein
VTDDDDDLKLTVSPVHRTIFKQAALTVRDIPYVLLLGLNAVLFWNYAALRRHLATVNSFEDQMKAVSSQFVESLLDLICIAILPVLLLSWRAPIVVRELRLKGFRDADSKRLLLWHLVSLVFDAPFIVLAPMSLWRLPVILCRLSPTHRVDSGISSAKVTIEFPPGKL